MTGPYDDIIHLPHHNSAKHPRMSAHDRAAQFSPFAALTGFESAITETARLTDEKVELDEYCQADLNERLRIIQEQMRESPADEQPEVTITYFQPDTQRTGGAYRTTTGCVKKIDAFERLVIMQDATRIPIDAILEIG